MDWQNIDWLNSIGSIASITGTIFAAMAWIYSRNVAKKLDNEKTIKSRKIAVVLQHGAEKIELPVELRRSELTRAEILGRIGMLPLKNKNTHFNLGYLNTVEFLDQVNKINQAENEGLLTIPCTKTEIGQFEIKKKS